MLVAHLLLVAALLRVVGLRLPAPLEEFASVFLLDAEDLAARAPAPDAGPQAQPRPPGASIPPPTAQDPALHFNLAKALAVSMLASLTCCS